MLDLSTLAAGDRFLVRIAGKSYGPCFVVRIINERELLCFLRTSLTNFTVLRNVVMDEWERIENGKVTR